MLRRGWSIPPRQGSFTHDDAGGDIAIFSDEAKEHTASIRKDLAFVAKDNSNLSDPIVAKAMENMKKSLGILESKAMARREYCKEIVGKLSKVAMILGVI